jgi:mannose-6-phosphate isomerase-like protein (cupin superfamily)
MSEFKLIQLPTFPDSRGQLTVMQQVLPFEIRRVFWITQADTMLRGGHRHHNNRQGLVAIAGQVVVSMNDGKHKGEIRLARQNECLIVEPDDWHTMAFGAGAILLVFASHLYDVKDYIDAEY